jgi:hypothetical protein
MQHMKMLDLEFSKALGNVSMLFAANAVLGDCIGHGLTLSGWKG